MIRLTMIAAISGSVSNKDFSRAYIVMSTVMSVMTPIAVTYVLVRLGEGICGLGSRSHFHN